MASYSQELKDSIVTRLITGETSASDLARETGISINTIYRWRDKAKKKWHFIYNKVQNSR